VGEVGGQELFYHFSPFPFVPFMFPPVPAVTWDGFSPVPFTPYFPGPNSDPYILTPLYFILASGNLFQSIPRTRFSKVRT